MTRLELCTMPTQFTSGKTKATLQRITKRYLLNKNYENGIHTIEIIVTNLSLQETEQWKCRSKNTFANEVIDSKIIFFYKSI